MPSAQEPSRFNMEKPKASINISSAQPDGESNTFICTECGDGFNQYSSVLAHMTNHGPLESFSFDGSSNGLEFPQEYVLQENGTLTALKVLPQSLPVSSAPPVPPIVQPSPVPSLIRPASPSSRPRPPPLKDVINAKPPESGLEKSRQCHHRCEICYRVFNTLQSLHSHHQYRNTGKGHKCTLCCRVFTDENGLRRHLRDHSGECFHCCSHCGKRFLKSDALKAHQRKNHLPAKATSKDEKKKAGKAYTCRKCELSFFWLSDFQTHSLHLCKGTEVVVRAPPEIDVDLNEPEEDMPPGLCLTNGDSLDMRIGNKMIDLEPHFTPYRCGLCGDRFEDLSALKAHHVTHQSQEEIDRLKADFIKPITPTKRGRRRKPFNPNGKLHPCKHCQRVFNHSSSLSRHMRYHKGTMHTCICCGRHFPQRCDLRRHIAMYHNTDVEKKPNLKHLISSLQNSPPAKPVMNEQNGDSYDDISDSDGSSKEKQPVRGNYKCEECGKKFGLLCVYQRHLRYHKKEPSKYVESSSPLKSLPSFEPHLQDQPNLEVKGKGNRSSGIEASVDEDKDITENEEDDQVDLVDNNANSLNNFYECTKCTETFSSLDTFRQHQSTHSTENNV